MKKVNQYLEQHVIKIIILFLFLQPFLDVITSFCLNILNIQITVGIIFRMLFLLFLVYYFLFIYKYKDYKKTFLYLSLIAGYIISFFLVVLFNKGTSAILYEMQGLLRTFYFPIILILLWQIITHQKETIDIKHCKTIMFIYVIFIVIPTITNTGFESYTQGKIGNIGWFHSTNEISAILSIFLPFCTLWILNKDNNTLAIIKKIIYIIFSLFALFTLGTKMTIISLCLVILVFGIKQIRDLIKKKQTKQLSFLCSIIILLSFISIIVIPKTSFYKNIIIHLEFLGIDNITDIITNPELLDHFVFSQRLTFLKETRNNYQKSSIIEKLLGIGYIENYGTDEVNIKLIEMDIPDIFYRHGIIGFLIYFLPVIYFVTKSVRKTLSNKKKDKQDTSFLLSIFLAIFMSIFVGHVFTSPAVSIFVSIIIILNYQRYFKKNPL